MNYDFDAYLEEIPGSGKGFKGSTGGKAKNGGLWSSKGSSSTISPSGVTFNLLT